MYSLYLIYLIFLLEILHILHTRGNHIKIIIYKSVVSIMFVKTLIRIVHRFIPSYLMMLINLPIINGGRVVIGTRLMAC